MKTATPEEEARNIINAIEGSLALTSGRWPEYIILPWRVWRIWGKMNCGFPRSVKICLGLFRHGIKVKWTLEV